MFVFFGDHELGAKFAVDMGEQYQKKFLGVSVLCCCFPLWVALPV